MTETPLAIFLILIVGAFLVAAAFYPVRRDNRLTPEEDRADLAETERKIEQIEREARGEG